MTRSIPGSAARHRHRNALAFTVLAMVLAAGLVGLRVRAFGPVTALLSIGPRSPAFALVHAEIPHVYTVPEAGHDGAYFYAIARRPFAIAHTSRYLAPPTFRYRRILFPLLAGGLAPHGGTRLVYAFLLVSLAGVGLGAWSLSRLPGAPPWLPLTMTLNPGILAALFLTLSDALATGLVLAAFAAMSRRRIGLVVGCLALAGLTRETALVAALALACWPALDRRQRVVVAVTPVVPVVLWSAFVSAQSHTSSVAQPQGGALSWPLLGWLHSRTTLSELLMSLALAAVLVLALRRWRDQPISYSLFIGATLAVLVCSAPTITHRWYDATRIVAPAFPIAVWMLTAPAHRADRLSPRRAARA